jgi:hypothetical protein
LQEKRNEAAYIEKLKQMLFKDEEKAVKFTDA